MRIDLARDFQKLLNSYFLEFVKKIKKKNREYQGSFSTDFMHFKGEAIFRSTLYFCCKKAYYTLELGIFNQVANKDCLMFKRHCQEWEPCVDIHDVVLVRELSKKYDYQKQDKVRVVDYHFIRHEKIHFYIGFCIDLADKHQVFYIWDYTVPLSLVDKAKMIVLEIEKMKHLAYHKAFLNFSREQKKNGESGTVEDFYATKFINRKTFQKKHKETLETTFYDYSLQIRSLHTLKLILTTSEPIKLIPSKVDANDYSVLAKAFRKKQFLSPSRYRDSFL